MIAAAAVIAEVTPRKPPTTESQRIFMRSRNQSTAAVIISTSSAILAAAAVSGSVHVGDQQTYTSALITKQRLLLLQLFDYLLCWSSTQAQQRAHP